MSDFAFLDSPPPKRSQQEHYRDVLRECLKRKIDDIDHDFAEAQRYCRDLIRAGGDVTEEVKAIIADGYSMALVGQFLQREAKDAAETAPFWTQDVAE